MKIFGPAPWGPALDGDVAFVPTPVGEKCIQCQEPIADSDSGLLMPFLSEAGPREVAEHRECFLRGVVGSVGHQLGRCSCFGGTEDDPPGMTKRAAARAAVALFERRRSGS